MTADGRAGVSKVMVILSDGAANTGQNCPAKNAQRHLALDERSALQEPVRPRGR